MVLGWFTRVSGGRNDASEFVATNGLKKMTPFSGFL